MKKLLSIFALSAVALAVNAKEAPDASELVGKVYGGVHGLYLHNDGSRNISPANDATKIVDGNGYGVTLGYRFTENVEFRLGYTDLSLNSRLDSLDGSTAAEGEIIDADVLIFPTAKNAYIVAGVNTNEMAVRHTSMDLGVGYRHYLTDRFALYLETKGLYNFEDELSDVTAAVGLTYFFGSESKPAPKPAPAPVAVEEPKVVDSDNDGVDDTKDMCDNSPVEYKVDASGCTVYTQEEVSVNLLVNFANNDATVPAESMAKIQELADFMKAYPDTTVVIEGHTSQLGKAEYNQQLSEARAQAVADILVNQMGISADRVSAKGYGETQLLDPALTPEAHRKNRRIEAKITSSVKVPVKR